MTIPEINSKFPTDIDASLYFEHLRWGNINKCAYCNSSKISQRQLDSRFHCSVCRRTFSVTTGTLLHSSKVPLKSWLYALSNITRPGKKISIMQLKRDIKVSYSTAWTMFYEIKKLSTPEIEEIFAEDMLLNFVCRKAISGENKKGKKLKSQFNDFYTPHTP